MTEKTIDKKIMTYGSVTLILSLVAIVLRTVCLFTSFDAYIGYYKEGFLTSVMNAFLVISAICLISANFTVKDDVCCSDGRESNKALRLVSILPTMGFVYLAELNFSLAFAEYRGSLLLFAVTSILAVLSAVYFMVKLFEAKNNTVHALIGFAVIIFCIVAIISSYFDIYELLNGPNKVMMHLSLISIAFFMLAEIRAYADKIKKGFYVATLCVATFFSGACSIPTLIFYFVSEHKNSYLAYHIVIAGIFAYLLARLISFVLASAYQEGETASFLVDATPMPDTTSEEERQ